MNNPTSKKLFDMYGIATNFSALTPDSIRYPPSANVPIGLVNVPKLKEKLSSDNAALTPTLENFTQMYQQMAAGLIDMSIDKLIPGIERGSIVKESLSKNGFIAVCKNQNEVIELANKIAPEHMELMVKNAKSLSKKITGAGLLLIGKYSPSAASDYSLGTNHILPTNGFGRTRGGLSVLDFMKLQTVVEAEQGKLHQKLRSIKALTDAEGLPNHYKAVKRRVDE